MERAANHAALSIRNLFGDLFLFVVPALEFMAATVVSLTCAFGTLMNKK
jgi:hypothetical protein